MTWRKRAHVVTSGECGPPVVQVMKRNTAPSSDGDRARQMPQARSCGEQGSDELYSGSCEHTGGETFKRGSTQRAHSKAGQGVGQRTGGSVAGT
jgi:hypothetical protein